jgi:hypothetical protein
MPSRYISRNRPSEHVHNKLPMQEVWKQEYSILRNDDLRSKFSKWPTYYLVGPGLGSNHLSFMWSLPPVWTCRLWKWIRLTSFAALWIHISSAMTGGSQRSEVDGINLILNESIGFVWIPFDQRTMGRDVCQAWRILLTTRVIPRYYRKNPSFGIWVMTQCKQRDKLNPTRRERLDYIGFVWQAKRGPRAPSKSLWLLYIASFSLFLSIDHIYQSYVSGEVQYVYGDTYLYMWLPDEMSFLDPFYKLCRIYSTRYCIYFE